MKTYKELREESRVLQKKIAKLKGTMTSTREEADEQGKEFKRLFEELDKVIEEIVKLPDYPKI